MEKMATVAEMHAAMNSGPNQPKDDLINLKKTTRDMARNDGAHDFPQVHKGGKALKALNDQVPFNDLFDANFKSEKSVFL